VTVASEAPNLAVRIGETVIPFSVRASDRAKRKRIVVRPGAVEVVVPTGTPLEGPVGARAYVEGKRRWLFDAVREIDERQRVQLTQMYASGAKLQFRGRWVLLDVGPGDVDRVQVRYRNRFHVTHPAGLDGTARLLAVRDALDAWLRWRALDDVERYGALHAAQLGVEPAGYRLSDAKGRWGSCGRDRVVRVHWQLVQAPSAALEYVVAHELAHLIHRTHQPAFWATVARTLPEWESGRGALERWERERRSL
jgi:predicted metal-dependent hydrolase